MTEYFRTLSQRFGEGWNQFWFLPSDSSALGALRAVVGAIVTYFYLTFLPDWQYFFGPSGLLPADEVATLIRRDQAFTLLDYISEPSALWAFYFAGLIALICLTIGLMSRIAAVVSLAVIVSINMRAPLLITPAAEMIPLFLVYLSIGSSGAAYSVDALIARRRRKTVAGESVFSTIAQRLLQIHLTLVYVMMAIAQLKFEPWWSGNATWLMIARPESRLVDLTWLSSASLLVDFLTHAFVLFELAFALLVWNRTARPLMLGLATIVWCLFGIVSGMVVFSLLMIAGNLAFVSGASLRAWRGERARVVAPRVA